jgi:OOP family OmpA-OmpF porin
MSLRRYLLAVSMLGAPFLLGAEGRAQPVDGLYIGLGAGGNYLQQERVLASPGLALSAKRLSTDVGGVGVASIGWGFGNGLRVEVEGDVRHNRIRGLTGFAPSVSPTAAGGDQFSYAGMVNALFDMDIGYNWIYPYFGLGAGIADTQLDSLHAYGLRGGLTSISTGAPLPIGVGVNGWSTNFAYQGIFGLSFPLAPVPGLSLTTEYRFYGVLDAPGFHGHDNVVSGNRGVSGNFNLNSDYNHSLIVGVRYAFNTAPPPVPAAPVVSVPAPAPARTYLVFFDWDRADLTDRARQIITEAAAASTRVQTTRIDVQGNADRSGTPAYNLGLSRRRAEAVAAELVRHGVPQAEISIQAFGDTRPLVPTAAGVREPQNRRVEIILH